MAKARVPVRRTAKLYIGGEFPRSESGRSYEVFSHGGEDGPFKLAARYRDEWMESCDTLSVLPGRSC